MKKLILFVMVLALQVQAWAVGNEIANGGDSISAEFIRHGQIIGDLWKQLNLPKDFPVTAAQFKDVVREAIVETRDSVDIDGRVLDAINIPTQKRIVVSRSRWAQIDDYKKIVIVFHEYVGLISASDRNFEVAPSVIQSLTKVLAFVTTPSFGNGGNEMRFAASEILCTGRNSKNDELGFRVMLDSTDVMISLETIGGDKSNSGIRRYSAYGAPTVMVKWADFGGGIEMFGFHRLNDGLDYDERVFWVKDAPKMSVLQTRYYSDKYKAVKDIKCVSKSIER